LDTRIANIVMLTVLSLAQAAMAQPGDGGAPDAPTAADKTDAKTAQAQRRLFIREYRVSGVKLLGREEIEKAVYPFMGPERRMTDIEKARAAIEKAYQDKGYQTVAVQVPPQQIRGGIVKMRVVEMPVERVEVRGAKYFSPAQLKKELPSAQPGKVINFNELSKEIGVAGRSADRQITPSLEAGTTPGTVKVVLAVDDKLPIHGSLELNNRYSADTTALRLNGSVTATNLWQAGHMANLSFQLSPEDTSQVKVFSGYYFFAAKNPDWLSLTLEGSKQDSNVSTLGGLAVAGRGETLGLRATASLPGMGSYFHTLNASLSYKHFNQLLAAGSSDADTTMVTYYPLSVAYAGTYLGKNSETNLNTSATMGLRGLGSDESEFSYNRYGSRGDFFYVRADASHSREILWQFKATGRVYGQISDQPLISNEQYSAGGMDTVRGYLEAECLGDNAIGASFELRSPQLSGYAWSFVKDWTAYCFVDAAHLGLVDPLAQQDDSFNIWSLGIGTDFKLFSYFNGVLNLAVPMDDSTNSKAYEPRLTFRAWSEF
jgi:hemolysin activation/secretion protein